MPSNPKIKHEQVRHAIVEAIRNGEFAPGERLPAERDLAMRFGVSYMTARRAITEMVEADLLERRAREGTYVRPLGHKRLSTTTVNLICSADQTTSAAQFLRLGAKTLAERGWRHAVIRWHPGQVRPAVRALDNGEPSLVMASGPELQGPIGEAMQRARGKAVLLGNRLDSVGVPSVLADDSQAIRIAVDYLRAAGHEKIALISDHADHAIDRVQIAAWRSCFAGKLSPEEIERRLIVVNTPDYESLMHHTYRAVSLYLNSTRADATAMICLGVEMTIALLAACRDARQPVPQKMSVVSAGNSSLIEFAHPPVTCIDVHMDQHIVQAMEMLEAAMEERLPDSDRLRFILPHLVERESVSKLR